MTAPSLIVERLPSLLRQAGRIMLDAHTVRKTVTVKDGTANFVTEYDTRVQQFLKAELQKLIPTARFMAEEQENECGVVEADCCFVIDPIDGTTNFICDYHHSCISVAMLSKGIPEIGAIYDPYMDELFFAQRGKGATCNGTPIHVSDTPLSGALVAYGTAPYYREELGEATFSLLKELFFQTTDIRRCGSAALDLAYLAAGRNDVFFELLLSPWDYAAGAVLISEAGGILTQLDGSPVSFEKPQPILASNQAAYADLLAVAKPYQRKE